MARMKEAKITEVKNQLSRYLDLVRQGETIRILDRNTPIAHIVPIGDAGTEQDAGDAPLAEMERKGLVRRGSRKLDEEILRALPSGKVTGAVDALLEDRDRR